MWSVKGGITIFPLESIQLSRLALLFANSMGIYLIESVSVRSIQDG